jgi:3-methyl-2-oxobutanoate hydroxymethyltransferase
MTTRMTAVRLTHLKTEKKKIVALTAYDYPTAVLLDESGVDLILVGDSVGENVLGYPDSIHVTMEDMIHHTKAVARGVKNALVIGDLPFLSYQAIPADAIRNAGRFLQEAGAQGVKMEGGQERIKTVCSILEAGIPVLGHIGLKPQSLYRLGGYKVQGKTAEEAKRIFDDAIALQKAGCFAIVLELVPDRVAKIISEHLTIPTIGIGSGSYCDGQILVIQDALGMTADSPKKHSKQYAQLNSIMKTAVKNYSDEVRQSKFPTSENSFEIKDEEFEELIKLSKLNR